MRITSILFFVVFYTFKCSAQDYWEQKDSINGPPRSSVATFNLGIRGYVVGGFDGELSIRKMYSYSAIQNDWDSEAPIGGLTGGGLERSLACGFSIGEKGYVCLGQGLGNAYMKDLWEYDNETQTWSQKADFAGSARKGAVSFVINDAAYVGTGQDITGLRSDFYKFNPILNTWIILNNFPGGARRQAVGFELAGYGWLGTGDAGVLKNDFWSYNSQTDEWQQKSNLPGDSRIGAVSWSTYPSAYIALGQTINGEYKKDVWQYNYFQNQWVQKNDFGGPARVNALSFIINDIPYVGAGYNGEFIDDFYAYHGLAEVGDENPLQSIQIFPNPSTNEFQINGLNSHTKAHIYNSLGVLIKEYEFENMTQSHFNLNEHPSGVYIIHLTDRNFIKAICFQKI